MRFGPFEIILIIVIILLITGAAFVPAVGRTLGKGVRQLRSAVGGEDKTEKTKVVTKLEDGIAAKEVNRRARDSKEGTKTG
ncbi:twin-arginine translocase TatA/TatE family subunit [Dehalogenimonas sp. THU2]|uniref:twin-arginine translocase TatA/TatE family subunit n=1 Tax=Dehalogenimonas sp. THU2 TaxID=3151121 RepID=UPI00321839FA